MANFAEQLTAARKAAGMPQEQLSEAVHVARNTISNWERGQRQPDLDTLRLLGQVLHTDFLNPNTEETIDEAPSQDAVVPEKRPGKRWPVLAAAAVVVLGVALWLILGNKKPMAYEPAARLADEAGQLTIEFFQKPVQQTGGMLPYLAYSYETSVESVEGGDVFFYTFRFRETNGHPFTINSAVAYSFSPNESFTDAFPAERLAEYGIAAEIPAYGEWSFGGGFPVQPYLGVAIILYGEDEHGNEMEFHGYIDYQAASSTETQK